MIVLFIILFSLLININRFFEYKIINFQLSENFTLDRAVPTLLRQDPAYSKVSTVCSLTLLHLLPLVSLAYLNCAIYTSIRARSKRLSTLSKHQRRDLVVGTFLISIVCVFLGCHSLKFVINLIELWTVVTGKDPEETWSHKMNIMVAASHLLITLNCSVNSIIYCCKDGKFRSLVVTRLSELPLLSPLCLHTSSRSIERENLESAEEASFTPAPSLSSSFQNGANLQKINFYSNSHL